jgi:hypothetical protein
MSRSTNLPFSVAKFTIEGVGEGADQIHTVCPAPPRLSGPQTASVSNISFPINPFSLSRSPLLISHTSSSVSSPQISNSVHICASSSSSPALVSSSSCVHSLFTNPFLVKQSSDSQPALIQAVAKNSAADSFAHPSPLVPPIPNLQNSSILRTSSITRSRKPCKPRPDRIIASSPFRPRAMAVDRCYTRRSLVVCSARQK